MTAAVSNVYSFLGEAAMKYAASGLRVFPLAPRGKEPLVPKYQGGNGCKDGTTDSAQVRAWWQRPDANIGWAITPEYVVLDFDPKNGGVETRAKLEAEHGPLPPTKTHITGSDDGSGAACHLIYRINGIDPDDLRGNLGPGVDVKKAGGYIVMPPSIHKSGNQYQDATPGVAPVPLSESWLAALRKPERTYYTAPKGNWHTDTAGIEHPLVRDIADDELGMLAGCPESGGVLTPKTGKPRVVDSRSMAINICAMTLGRFPGLDREWIRQGIHGACDGSGNGYIVTDGLAKTNASIDSGFAAANKAGPRAISESEEYGDAYQFDPAAVLEQAKQKVAHEQAEADVDLLAEMCDGAWLSEQVFKALSYIVPGIMPEGATILSSAPKTGKSWLALLIALMCAAGREVLGQKVDARPVLYLALEDGHRRIQDRARALWGDDEPLPKWFHYMLVVDPRLAVAVVLAFLDRYPGEQPLIIIDTLGRVKPQKRAGDEAYLSDYHFAAALKAAIDTRPGAALLAIHHTRKAESEDFVEAGSGTLGLAGAFDTVMVLRRKRHEQTGVLLVSGRDVEEGRYALRVNNGRWELDAPTLFDAAELADRQVADAEALSTLSERTRKVLDVVRMRGAEDLVTSPNDVVQQSQIDPRRAAEVLRRLHTAGHIEKIGMGTYAMPRPSKPAPANDSAVSAVVAVVAGGQGVSPTAQLPHSAVAESDQPYPGTATTALPNPSAVVKPPSDQPLPQLPHIPHNPVLGPLVAGPGRCCSCGCHIETQGHRANCPEQEEES